MAERPAPSPARPWVAPLALSGLLAALACGWGFHHWLESPAHEEVVAQRVAPAPSRPRSADFGAIVARADVHRVADWSVASADHGTQPFAVVDKVKAMLYVFAPTGRLVGASPVLLGLARGDDTVPGIGDRPIAAVRPEERTTPAGRFVAEPGENLGGENVIWVDYDAAVSMHRVRMVDPKERRFERLRSPNPADRRISYGCINVPVPFFESVVWPLLKTSRAVAYVLPETRPVGAVFAGAYDASMKSARTQSAARDVRISRQ